MDQETPWREELKEIEQEEEELGQGPQEQGRGFSLSLE